MWQKIKSFLFENKTAKQTVAKNTVWLSISNFGGRLLKAGVVIYGARVLGAAGYGVFSYAVTLAGFFCLFMDPGINAILVREGAKASPTERQSLFSTTLIIKAVIAALTVAAVVLIGPFFSTLPGAKILLPLVALMIIFDGTRGFLSAMFDAEEKMEWDAAAFLATNVGILIFGFILLERSATPYSFTSGYVIGSSIGCAAALWLSRKNFKNIFSGVSIKRMAAILKTAWPFALTSALGVLLTNTDILVISWMRTAVDVGIYSAAIRIVQLLYLVPGIIATTTLPIFSRLAKRDPLQFRLVLERTVSLIFLISVPISLGGAILAGGILQLVFGSAYVAGSVAFSILMLSLSFDYTGGILGNAVFAYDRQKSLIVCSVLGGVGNVVFDLLLIPRWGIAGSAVATLLAQILSQSYLWYTMNKLNRFHVLPRIRKILVAGALMAVVTILLSTMHTNVVLNVAISGVIYFSVLLLFKESLLGEIKQILSFGTSRT